jgi:hypothetical protein
MFTRFSETRPFRPLLDDLLHVLRVDEPKVSSPMTTTGARPHAPGSGTSSIEYSPSAMTFTLGDPDLLFQPIENFTGDRFT